MKRVGTSNPTRKSITELAQFRSAAVAKTLRVDLSALKGLTGLSPKQFDGLVGQLRVRSFRKRAIIYSAKQESDTIHIILSGIARLTSVNRKNERVLREVLGPGDVVCMPPLLPDVRHSLECEAFTDCEIGVLSADAMVETVGLEYDKFLLALKFTMGRWWALLSNHSDAEGNNQAEDHRAATPAASPGCSLNFNSDGPDPLLNPLLTCPKGSDDIQLDGPHGI